jgi:hypothetical protein
MDEKSYPLISMYPVPPEVVFVHVQYVAELTPGLPSIAFPVDAHVVPEVAGAVVPRFCSVATTTP